MATADRLSPADWRDVLGARGLFTMLLAGAVAMVAFDFFGQSLSPALGFATLALVPLANAVIQTVFGAPWRPGAEFLHDAAGRVAYPLGRMLVFRPLADRFALGVPIWISAGIYGVLLLGVRALHYGASDRRQPTVSRPHRDNLGGAGRSRALCVDRSGNRPLA